MEIVYDKSTGTWSEREEPYTTLDVQTEEDWNKLEFMINNFSRLEEENKELKRLLRLAVEDMKKVSDDNCCYHCIYGNPITRHCEEYKGNENCYKWQHAEEALKLIGDDE